MKNKRIKILRICIITIFASIPDNLSKLYIVHVGQSKNQDIYI